MDVCVKVSGNGDVEFNVTVTPGYDAASLSFICNLNPVNY